jgi:chromosome segregation ATPase
MNSNNLNKNKGKVYKNKRGNYWQNRKLKKKYSTKQFKKKSNKTVVNKTVINNYNQKNYKTYDNRRANYYDSVGYNPSPYIYNSYSSFGMWDAMFMWMLLDNINDDKYAKMYYKNMNDDGFEEFEEQLEELSEDNEELKKKLDSLNKKMESMKDTKVSDNYKIDGMDDDIMYSKDLLRGYVE